MRAQLPIDEVLDELTDAVTRHHAAVLRAPTGAGKTTRVAPALLDATLAGVGSAETRPVVLLEPRRIAARAAARRMAEERGGKVGEEVGYHVRFDRRAGRDTRILVVTEGIFLRMLQADPLLERVGAVVFDEFHERSLDSDLALAMVQNVRRELRPELPLVVMSATLDSAPIAHWLDDAPVVESEGRTFPVDIEYAQSGAPSIEDAVAAALAEVLPRTPGDVLVFLPGVGEIRRARKLLEGMSHDVDLVELYGELPPEKQDAVLRPGSRRKVVLATNVAETSVTVPGVTAVIDSGFRRVLRRDPAVGLDRLVLERVSKSSADQRAGRAGRTEPGMCLRLWSEPEYRAFPDFDEPELQRADLAGPVLQLAAWGETDFSGFGWFEAPPGDAVDQAVSLLERLGALGKHGLTDRGRSLAKIPAHPRLARLILAGEEFGHGTRAALAAALLAEKSPFDRDTARRGRDGRSESDVLDRVEALERFESGGSPSSTFGEIHRGAARTLFRTRDQFLRMVERSNANKPRKEEENADRAVLRAIAAAFPDRIARRRAADETKVSGGSSEAVYTGVLVGGRGVRLARSSSVVESELFACVDLDAGRGGPRSEAHVRLASAVNRDWLDADAIESSVVVQFDQEAQRVIARRQVRYHDLVLEESPAKLPAGEEVARILAEAVAAEPDPIAVFDSDDLTTFVIRARCLAEWRPDLELPAFDAESIRAWLPDLCRGSRSFADLKRSDALSALKGAIPYEQVRTIDHEAPERIEVPSGSRIRIQYVDGKPPVLAARIQELFGLADTPRIAGGRVAVLLHLLAPNHRPQQVTEDLRSFWDNTYPTVRKELRRRYPKHAWPEDPWNATAERRPQRRK